MQFINTVLVCREQNNMNHILRRIVENEMRLAIRSAKSESSKYFFRNAELAIDVFIRGSVIAVFLVFVDSLSKRVKNLPRRQAEGSR